MGKFFGKTDQIFEISIKIGVDKICKNQKLVIKTFKIFFYNFLNFFIIFILNAFIVKIQEPGFIPKIKKIKN